MVGPPGAQGPSGDVGLPGGLPVQTTTLPYIMCYALYLFSFIYFHF